jgi:alkylation response protein AidB-like acyl-CoA dehydrogenase
MEFSTAHEVEAFGKEVRALLAERFNEEQREAMHASGTFHDWELHRALAERGWLSAGLPGSEGSRDPFELSTLFAELERADAPYHGLSTTMIVAGVIAHMASPALKARVLPEIFDGDAVVALGYSEPDHGSDVAAASTRAIPNDAEHRSWTINGQKMWTSLAHVAQYVLLLTRTDTEVPKHRGLTMFLVPMDSPGVSVQPIRTMGDERTNITFYDGVVVGDEFRIGEVNGGWQVMGVALGLERGVMGGGGEGAYLWEHVREWAEAPGTDGRTRTSDPAMRLALARTRIDNEVTWLLFQRSAWIAASGGLPSIEGSMAKLFASEAFQRAARVFQDLAGAEGLVRAGQEASLAGGVIDRAARHAPVTTIYGGTSEIQLNNIAERYLGLPRSR